MALLLGVGAGMALWQLAAAPKPRVLELPDGSTLTFHGATYGTNHVEPGKPFLKLHRYFWNRMPGWIPRPSGDIINVAKPTLICWFEPEFVMGSPTRLFSLSATDRAGVELWVAGSGNSYSLGPGMSLRSGSRVSGHRVQRFPRREDRVRLGVYQRGEDSHPVYRGEFVFPNPARESFPTWKSEPLPATRTTNGLTVVVQQLVAGANQGHPGNPAPVTHEDYSLLECRLLLDGHPTQDWHVEAITGSDATGNSMPSHSHYTQIAADGLIQFYFEDFPWPSESPWKLRLELSRSDSALTNAADLWRLENLPLPDSDLPVTFTQTNLLHGVAWKLESISVRDESYILPPVKAYAVRFVTQAVGLSRPVQNDLIRMTDEKGRPITTSGRSSESHPGNQAKRNRDYWLRARGDATQVNLTLASHRSRFVEFTIAPALPAASEMKTATPDESGSAE